MTEHATDCDLDEDCTCSAAEGMTMTMIAWQLKAGDTFRWKGSDDTTCYTFGDVDNDGRGFYWKLEDYYDDDTDPLKIGDGEWHAEVELMRRPAEGRTSLRPTNPALAYQPIMKFVQNPEDDTDGGILGYDWIDVIAVVSNRIEIKNDRMHVTRAWICVTPNGYTTLAAGDIEPEVEGCRIVEGAEEFTVQEFTPSYVLATEE